MTCSTPRLARTVAGLGLLGLAPVSAAQAAPPAIHAGPLTVSPSSVAVRTPSGWAVATRVVGHRGRSTVLATRGGGAPRLTLTVGPARRGVTRVTLSSGARVVRAARIGFVAGAREQFYGLGERADAVGHRGATVENYVSDGPFSPETYNVVKNVIPPAGFRARRDATYFPVPWVLSSRGYGVLLDDDQTSRFDLADRSARRWTIEADAPALHLRVFDGRGSAARALARFTKATGRQPAVAAPWGYGPWFQTGQPNTVPLADEASWLAKLRAADAPVSAAETQLRYLPCGLDRGNEQYERDRVAMFHAAGLAILTYVNPMLCQSYEPLWSAAVAAGALQRRPDGSPATFTSFVGGTGPAGFSLQPVAQFDFATAAGRAQWGAVLRRMAAEGHDGWMEDFGEYTPGDAAGAATGLHNRYPTEYHCAAQAITRAIGRPIVRFQRSGWSGAARCASDVWGGDPTTTFGFDGLSSAVKEALGMGLSGISRWGSDIGGYDTVRPDPRLTPELLKRWIEFGAVSGVMRTKSSGLAVPAYQRPQIWDPGIVGTWRRYAKLHTQLYPYMSAADKAYRSTGLPLMRHLVLDARGQRWGALADSEFLFGPDLLAAPVVRAGARSRRVFLPRGRWLDGARALTYDARDGGVHPRSAAAVRGGRTVTVAASLETLPLFVRAGAILPLLPADVSTLADTGSAPAGIVRLKDRADRLRVLVYPTAGAGTTRELADGTRMRSRVSGGTWTLRIDGPRTKTYTIEASLTGIVRRHGACTVRGVRRADATVRSGVLTATVSGRSARIAVSGDCR